MTTTPVDSALAGIATTQYTEMDPRADPERANELLNKATGQDEAPIIAPRPPVDEFELTAGWLDRDGVLHKRVRVRELTGEDEEELARPYQRTVAKYIDTIISRCVVDMAGTKPTPELLGGLLLGDRDAIVLQVRVLTFGNNVEMPVPCPHCEHEFRINLDIQGDISVKELPGDPTDRQRKVELPSGGTALVNLMTGFAQLAAYDAPPQETNQAERDTIIMHSCVYSINGEPVTTMNQIRKLGAGDRRAIIRFLDENTCGPQWQGVMQECPNCQASFPITLSLVALFW